MSADMAAMPSNQMISPEYIAHFGLRCPPQKFDQMVDWHLNFFGADLVLRNETSAMLHWDSEHHRMVIIKDSGSGKALADRMSRGIYHISFSLKTLADLATSYEQKKAKRIVPTWPVNHGMSTSMYYTDPDGNEFEMQVDNFDTVEEARAFMQSDEFAQNPIGADFVPEELIHRLRSGEDEKVLKQRAQIGSRRTRYENSIYFKKPAEVEAAA